MLKEKVEKALNKQLNNELFSSYLYLSMSAYFDSKNLTGMANWMKIQADEEYVHARRFFEYIQDAGGKVELEQIEKPKTTWNNVVEVFEETLKHEMYITESINDLVSLALEEKDHATNSFLQWFVDEQVEEVSIADQILQDVKMVADNKNGLFMIDRELKSRTSVLEFPRKD